MASRFLRILKKQSPTTLIATLNQRFITPTISTHVSDLIPPNPTTSIRVPFPKTQDPNPSSPRELRFYPTFSFGSLLNPISPTGFIHIQSEVGEDIDVEIVSGDEKTIWADSVKKKRKRKMNKHKLKKLRKRLRRKT